MNEQSRKYSADILVLDANIYNVFTQGNVCHSILFIVANQRHAKEHARLQLEIEMQQMNIFQRILYKTLAFNLNFAPYLMNNDCIK